MMDIPSPAMPPLVPVTVEVPPPLAAASTRSLVVLPTVEADLKGRLQRLGVASEPEVRLHPGDPTRAVRVRVHGRLQPFAPELMTRVWLAVAPNRADVPRRQAPPSQNGFPDGWFTSFVEDLTDADVADEDWKLALRFVGQLAVEVAFERPECLLGPVQPGEGPASDSFRETQEELLAFGLLPSAEALAEALADGERTGRPVQDTVEALAAWRPDHVEILVSAALFRQLVTGDVEEPTLPVYSERVVEDVRAAFTRMERKLFEDLGLRVPTLVLRREDDLPERVLRLTVNNLVTPPVPVSSPASDVGAELRRQAGRLLGIEDVEWALARLAEVFPKLVSATLERIALGDLTRVLRALLEEQVTIRDLRALLERLVQYDTIPVDAHRHVVLDDRLPIPGEPSAPPGPLWSRYLAFVRSGSGLRNRLTHDYRLGDLVAKRLRAIRLPEQLEERLHETVAADRGPSSARSASEELREEVLAGVWQARSRLPERTTRFVLLVHDPLTRRVVRDQIAGELPGVPVVAEAELRQDVRTVEADGHHLPADTPTPPSQPTVRPSRRGLHVPRIPYSPPHRGV
jgi:hypothetical protein